MEKRNLNYVIVFTFAYVALGALLPLLGQYLKGIGFTGTQIGFITAAGTTVAIAASTFWGRCYNKSRNKKRVIGHICLSAAVICMALLFMQSYWMFLLFFCMLYFFQAPALAFVDAMAIEDEQPFAAARKWGAIGFALGVFIAGKLSEIFGLSKIFLLYTASFTVCAAIVYRMSKRQNAKGAPPRPRPGLKAEALLLQNKGYVKIIVCSFFMCGTNVANNVYFGFLYTEGGGSIAGIGLAFLLMAGSEAPFMAVSKRLADRFTLEKMLLLSMCISVVRFAWYATGPSAGFLIAFAFLQGMVNGIMLVEFIRYVAKVVTPDNLGMAISVYYALGSNLSTIICQLLGGILLDHFGANSVYAFFACMNITGVFLYIAGGLHKSKK